MPKARNRGFAGRYPTLAKFVEEYGTLEIGFDPMTKSFIRAIEREGSLIWQGRAHYKDVDHALLAAEVAIARWLKEVLGVEQG